jgi:DNA-binding SARP family transcriptional activator
MICCVPRSAKPARHSRRRTPRRAPAPQRSGASPKSTPTLAIRLLGEFQVRVEDKAVPESQWPRRQARQLVKLLALTPSHQLHRQQLIDSICPDLNAESGAASLHKIIHLARHALEPSLESGAKSQFIATHAQHVQLRAPGGIWIDVDQFEQLSDAAMRTRAVPDYERALALYGGDLLTEDRYADWCAPKRDQLRAVHEQLLLRLGRAVAKEAQHGRAIRLFETLVEAVPSNEEAHRELMTLYALTGRRSDALRQFRRCCDALRADLGAEPDEATVQLHRRIVARELPSTSTAQRAGGERPLDRIAVLPFDNYTDDATLEYLSGGIAESLIKNLSQIQDVRVVAFSTVAGFRGADRDPRAIGRELDVKAIVTGHISRVEGLPTIAAELVDAADSSRLWGEHYRASRPDVLAIQEEISREIGEKLRVRMTLEERRLMGKRYTTDPEAYRLYLKGRFHWNKRTRDGLTRGIDYFTRAIERDSCYALAFSGLADCFNLLSLYSVLPPDSTMPKAKSAATTALALDPALAEAHTSLAYTHLYFDWDWAAAEREFRQALLINPNYATAHHWYHEFLTAMGRVDEQSTEILLAQELDPLSLIINTDVGWGLYYRRSYDEAVEQLLHTLELDANFAVAHLILGLVYAQQHALDAAHASVQRAVDLSGGAPSTLAVAALAYVLALQGRRSDALGVVGQLESVSDARYSLDYCSALVLAGLNERSAACERLERAVEERYDRLVYLNVDPAFDPLRVEPRFNNVVRTIGLPPHFTAAATI